MKAGNETMKAESAPVFRSRTHLKAHLERVGAGQLVLANGCFDPLHVGHTRFLSAARARGDYLIVALNDDGSTHALKGKGRPITPAADRAEVLAALAMVDAVLIFGARHVGGLLKSLRPAYHAKGTDYTVDTVPERGTARSLGIETVIVGDPKTHASTDIIERVRQTPEDGAVDSR